LIWPKPFAELAVIEPIWPVVRSLIWTVNPLKVSNIPTSKRSPEFMKRSVLGFGVAVAGFVANATGFAGACELPFFVMNAKLTGSIPTVSRHGSLFTAPVLRSSDRLSMFSAAHQRVESQLSPGGQLTHPGG